MLDRAAIALLRPALTGAARGLARVGVRADQVTLAGFAIGMVAAFAIAVQHPLLGLAGIALSRLCDGLDGALARLTEPTDRGAFIDISLDFVFYASIPLAFAVADPAANALAAAALLAAFVGTTSTFLAFAVLAAQRGMASTAFPAKGIYYLGGLTEATETLTCFALLCVLTTVTRLWAGWSAFSSPS